MPDWDDLKYFLAVARNGSTLSAAKALSVNQSTVHRRLDELEKRLGRNLVLRSPSGYKLTELGEQMVAYAGRVEEAVLAFERRVSDARIELTGSIKLTCPDVIGSHLLRSGLIDDFHRRFPGLGIVLVMSDNLLDLGAGQADIAIRAIEPRGPDLFFRRIADSSWAIYASKAYCARNGTPEAVEDIDQHTVALCEVESGDHVVTQWLKRIAPAARVAARCNSVTGLLAAAKSGAGLTALPVKVGDTENDLVRVLGPIGELSTSFYLVVHRDLRDAPRVKAFSAFVDENLDAFRAVLA